MANLLLYCYQSSGITFGPVANADNNGNRNVYSMEELQNLQLYHANCASTLCEKTKTT